MSRLFELHLDKSLFKGTISINTGLYVNGEFINATDGGTIE